MDKLCRCYGYIPAGGLQIFFAIGGLFGKDIFIKFHSLQALIYWFLSVFLLFPFLWCINATIKFNNPISLPLILLCAFLFYFLLPFFFAYKAFKGQIFYLWIFGKFIAQFVKLEETNKL